MKKSGKNNTIAPLITLCIFSFCVLQATRDGQEMKQDPYGNPYYGDSRNYGNKIEVEITKLPPSATEKLAEGITTVGKALGEPLLGYVKSTVEMMQKTAQQQATAVLHGTTEDKINALKAALYMGAFAAAAPLMRNIIVGGSDILMSAIATKMFGYAPIILNKKQNPFYGRFAHIQRWAFGSKLQQMVFNPDVQTRLKEVEKKTAFLKKLIQEGKIRTYSNLLLYGVPGTGKTLFAQVLATKTDMDFLPVTAASLLQSGIAGIKYFDELIAMANSSSYGTIIFIDEADALFIDRTKLNPDSDHYKILNHILSIIDGRSNKFMVVAATNHAYLLDEAMGRRFQDRVFMPLPDTPTRIELLNLYAHQFLFNPTQTSVQFVADAKKLLSTALITQIADKTEGLSHSEIADLVEAMRNKAELRQRSLTLSDVQSALNEAIKKKEAQKADREKLEQHKAIPSPA